MSLYLVILFKQLYMFRAFLAHPQFLHCMVSRSLWKMCGCVVAWLGIRWLEWCDPSSHSTEFPLRQCNGRTDRTILATGYLTTRPHSHTFAINYV
jgi:hypothetical protein